MLDRRLGAQEGSIDCAYTNTNTVAPIQRAQNISVVRVWIRQAEIPALNMNLVSRRIWAVTLTSQTLNSRQESSWYPLSRRIGGPQGWFGCFGVENSLLTLPRIKPCLLNVHGPG